MQDMIAAVRALIRVNANRGLGEMEILMSHEAITLLKHQMTPELIHDATIRMPPDQIRIDGVLIRPMPRFRGHEAA